MAGPIILSGVLTASNTDVLQGTRLQTVPAGGALTFQLEADKNDTTDSHEVTIQLPGGDTPLEKVRVPAGGVIGSLDSRKMLQFTSGVAQGGHTVFSTVATGAAVLSYRVTYTPA